MKVKSPEKVDFDKYADEYNRILEEGVDFFGEESSYFAEYKIALVKKYLQNDNLSILDYGCGIGRNIEFLKKYFPHSEISGCDISEKSIQIASSKFSGYFFIISKESITQNSEKFDAVIISCVLHHIVPALRNETITSIYRLLKPGGCVFIFEHNPYNPVTQKIVKDCIWDSDAVLLNMKESKALLSKNNFNIVKSSYTLFFPAMFSFLRKSEYILSKIPLGGQYYVIGRK